MRIALARVSPAVFADLFFKAGFEGLVERVSLSRLGRYQPGHALNHAQIHHQLEAFVEGADICRDCPPE